MNIIFIINKKIVFKYKLTRTNKLDRCDKHCIKERDILSSLFWFGRFYNNFYSSYNIYNTFVKCIVIYNTFC